MLTDEQYDSCILAAIDFYGGAADEKEMRRYAKLQMGELYDEYRFRRRVLKLKIKREIKYCPDFKTRRTNEEEKSTWYGL